MDLFEKLYVVRKLIFLNQKEAADKAGIKQATISILERGERSNLPIDYINFLCRNGIDLNWVFNNDSDISNAFRKGKNHLDTENTDVTWLNPGNTNSNALLDQKHAEQKQLNCENSGSLDTLLKKLVQEIEKLNTTLSGWQ